MQQGSGSARRRALFAALAVAAVIGIPMTILQRYVATTRWGAIQLVVAWFVVAGVGLFLYFRRRPGFRLVAAGTYAAVLLGTVAIGYWTGFRDIVVDENIVVATARASGAERDRGLAEAAPPAASRSEGNPPGGGGSTDSAPVGLATGEFVGADGHAGSGTASVVLRPSGQRLLTFTRFDVDPGVDVDVYLVGGGGTDVSDRVELGNLKGNVGNQQYEIPADADLNRYGTVVLWCKPFTVRIAVAELDV